MSDATEALRFVGRDVARPDGAAKADGSAAYVADLDVPGVWFGATVRSDVACGELLGFEVDAAFAGTGALLVTAKDVPGRNLVALIAEDQPLLVESRIEHHGEALALVAAPTRGALARALAAVRPRVAERPAHFEMETAEHTFKKIEFGCGDVDAAFAGAAHVIEGLYRTDSQEQMYIEPQGFVAFPPEPDGTVTVRGSLQCPYYVQKALCAAFGLPPERARVIACEVGGGFGGKEDYPSVVACHAALLARAAKAPVQLIYDRHEDLAATPKRHPSRVRHRTAVDGEGNLLAMDIDVLLDGGAYTTLSPVVLSRGLLHATGPYRCANVRVRGRAVKTNHVPYGAFRGFGAPQTCFAIERQMDKVARTLGIHPFALRERCMLQKGDHTATGQQLLHSVGGAAVLRAIAERTGFDQHPWGASRNGRVRRGLGFSFFWHGAGFTGSGEVMLQSRVVVRLLADGRATVCAAATEIGQGTRAMFRAIAAETLGAELDDVELAEPDTAAVPNSGPTVASRTCMIVGGLVARACAELRVRVGSGEAPFRARAAAFVRRGGDAVATAAYAPPPGLAWDDAAFQGDAYPVYAWAADVVEVEVDTATFTVQVKRLWTAVDVGRAIQPRLVEGQIEGGSLQALGFAHLEVVNTANGRFRQDRMATCIVPTSIDAPPMEVMLVEEPYAHGPFGAKGIGELPVDGGAPAVASAIEDALGTAPDWLPATPERLLELWLAAHPTEILTEEALA